MIPCAPSRSSYSVPSMVLIKDPLRPFEDQLGQLGYSVPSKVLIKDPLNRKSMFFRRSVKGLISNVSYKENE